MAILVLLIQTVKTFVTGWAKPLKDLFNSKDRCFSRGAKRA